MKCFLDGFSEWAVRRTCKQNYINQREVFLPLPLQVFGVMIINTFVVLWVLLEWRVLKIWEKLLYECLIFVGLEEQDYAKSQNLLNVNDLTSEKCKNQSGSFLLCHKNTLIGSSNTLTKPRPFLSKKKAEPAEHLVALFCVYYLSFKTFHLHLWLHTYCSSLIILCNPKNFEPAVDFYVYGLMFRCIFRC